MEIPVPKMTADAALVSLATSKAVDALKDAGHRHDADELQYHIGRCNIRALATLYHFITTI